MRIHLNILLGTEIFEQIDMLSYFYFQMVLKNDARPDILDEFLEATCCRKIYSCLKHNSILCGFPTVPDLRKKSKFTTGQNIYVDGRNKPGLNHF